MVSRPWILIVYAALSLGAACSRSRPGISLVEVARAYLEASRDWDFDHMAELLAPGTTVFERSDEGAFSEYRHSHLAPELAGLRSMAMTLGEARLHESSDETLAVVAWPIRRFTMERSDGSMIDANGAATFVLSPHGDEWWIDHVHFNLRMDQDSDSHP
jgi:ketosteroid isomerase-like protein